MVLVGLVMAMEKESTVANERILYTAQEVLSQLTLLDEEDLLCLYENSKILIEPLPEKLHDLGVLYNNELTPLGSEVCRILQEKQREEKG